MDEISFNALVEEITQQGFDEATSAHFASLIGDTPELDEQGRVVIRDDAGAVLATLALKFYDE